MAGVKYDDLANAVEFASISGFDNSAYVCTCGATYYVSSEIDEEVPEDLETGQSIQVPPKGISISAPGASCGSSKKSCLTTTIRRRAPQEGRVWPVQGPAA